VNALREEFLRLLRAELIRLAAQIDALMADYEARKEKGTVTEHVFFENEALMGSERCCLRSFMRILDQVNPAQYASVDAMAADIARRFQGHVEISGSAPCARILAETRMERIRQRVLESASAA
jgi:hypothetical protein